MGGLFRMNNDEPVGGSTMIFLSFGLVKEKYGLYLPILYSRQTVKYCFRIKLRNAKRNINYTQKGKQDLNEDI